MRRLRALLSIPGKHIPLRWAVPAIVVGPITIVGTVIFLSLPLHQHDGDGPAFETKEMINHLEGSLKLYSARNGSFPDGSGRTVFPILLEGEVPFIENVRHTRDEWGQELRYEWPTRRSKLKPAIWSVGPDGIDGTDDDITNWSFAR